MRTLLLVMLILTAGVTLLEAAPSASACTLSESDLAGSLLACATAPAASAECLAIGAGC